MQKLFLTLKYVVHNYLFHKGKKRILFYVERKMKKRIISICICFVLDLGLIQIIKTIKLTFCNYLNILYLFFIFKCFLYNSTIHTQFYTFKWRWINENHLMRIPLLLFHLNDLLFKKLLPLYWYWISLLNISSIIDFRLV